MRRGEEMLATPFYTVIAGIMDLSSDFQNKMTKRGFEEVLPK
jgi:hypothetical protein